MRTGYLAGAVALALLGGCEKDRPAPPTGPGALYDLRIASGDNQRGAPGEELPQPLVVEAVDREGRPVSGVRVQFAVASGGGALSDTAAATGSDGRAQTRLTLGPGPGINQVRAGVQGLEGLPPTFTARGEAAQESGAAGPVRLPDGAHFSLAAEKLNLPGGVRFGLTDRITAFVFDASSNPVTPGTVVRFRTDGGGIEELARTDSSGQALAILTTAEPLPADGRVRVTAQTRGAGEALLSTQLQVLFSGPTVVRLIQPARFEVAPGGAQTFLFFVGDASGNPLAGGTRIAVTAEGGTVSGQTDITLPDTQSPEATLFSASFQAGPEGQIPRLSIAVESPNGDQQVSFVAGATPTQTRNAPAALAISVADSVLVADGTSQTQITAAVVDSAGNGVPGVAVQFSASAGAIEASGLTDEAGRTAARYRSPAEPAGVPQVEIEARAGQLAASAGLRLLGVRLALSAVPQTLAADGIAQSAITAALTTEEGGPVVSVPVEFSATGGSLSTSRMETDGRGQAMAVYRSAASPADLEGIEVRAQAAGLEARVGLQPLGVRVALSASPDTIAADGNAQARIRAQVQRSDGVAIAHGAVHFATSLGILSSPVVETDGEGMAEAILVAGIEAGKAVVSATYAGSLSAQVAVVFAKGPPASIAVVAVEPPAISVQGSGGNETAIVTFEVRDERGNAVADGEPVLFRLDVPTGGGERVGPERTATVGGRVQAAVSSGTRARTVRLIAEAPLAFGDTVRSTPVPIAIHGGLPDQAHFSLASSPVNLAGRVLFGLESAITAYVFDQYSNPVRPGTAIRFRTDGGGVQGSAQTDENGQGVVALFTAEPMPPGPAFLATITGQTVDENGQEIEASTLVLFSGPTAPIRLTGAGADTVAVGRLFVADGAFQIIPFSVSDLDGNPLMGGSTIRVTSDVARISGDAEIAIPDAISGNTDFAIAVADPVPLEEPAEPPQRGSVLIQVRSRNGDRQLTFSVTVD